MEISYQFFSQLQGCVNLYQIDPSDRSVLEELRQKRRQFAELLLNIEIESLESLFSSDMGKGYQSIIKCGIQSEQLTLNEQRFFDELINNLTQGYSQTKNANYLLATLLYRPAKHIPLDNFRNSIPQWFQTLVSPTHTSELVQKSVGISSPQWLTNEAIKSLSKFSKPYMLNVGCGSIRFDGWINIDLEAKKNIVDIVWDASKKLSFLSNSSCKFVYNEHFLEHLTIEQAKTFLLECHRVLEPGGTLRIAMPSLDYVVQKYSSENWRDQEWLKLPEYQFIQTRAEMINIAFRWWGHQWLYDREELDRRLHEAVFTKLRSMNWGASDVPALRNRETRKDSILIYEAIK